MTLCLRFDKVTDDEHEWQCNDVIADDALCKATGAGLTDVDKEDGNRHQKGGGKSHP